MVTAIALTVTNLIYLAVVVLCVIAVGTVAPAAASTGALRPYLLAGAAIVVFSAFIAVMNGTPGQDTLVTVPGPEAPSWLGGLRFGGPLTREGLVAAGTRSLAILAIFGAFAIVTTTVTPGRLLRTTPAALFEAGLVVTVGLALLPATLNDLKRLREAEALRGRRLRWWRLAGLVTPAVLGGLERSIRLVEALEARGFGTPVVPTVAFFAGAASPPLLLLAAYLWISGGNAQLVALVAGAVGATGIAWWLLAAARSHHMTRLEDEPGRGILAITAVLALVASTFFIAARSAGAFAFSYDPFLDAAVPPFSLVGAAACLVVMWPFLVLVRNETPAETNRAMGAGGAL